MDDCALTHVLSVYNLILGRPISSSRSTVRKVMCDLTSNLIIIFIPNNLTYNRIQIIIGHVHGTLGQPTLSLYIDVLCDVYFRIAGWAFTSERFPTISLKPYVCGTFVNLFLLCEGIVALRREADRVSNRYYGAFVIDRHEYRAAAVQSTVTVRGI